MSKLKLFCDADNVVIPTNEIMPRLYEELTGIKPKAYTTKEWNMKDVYEPHELDKNTVHKLFEVERFFEMAKPYKNCKETLFNLKDYYDIYFVSVGSAENLALKRKWLNENFPFIPEENHMLLEQVGKAHSIDKSCCKDGVIIDDNLSALLSTKNCLKIMYQSNGDRLAWQEGYEELLANRQIHKVATVWDKELEEYLIDYADFLGRWE